MRGGPLAFICRRHNVCQILWWPRVLSVLPKHQTFNEWTLTVGSPKECLERCRLSRFTFYSALSTGRNVPNIRSYSDIKVLPHIVVFDSDSFLLETGRVLAVRLR